LDYLLAEVEDKGTAIHEECECYRAGRLTGVADYFIRVYGRWVPVEAKLNVRAVRDLRSQIQKYIRLDEFSPRSGNAARRLVKTDPSPLALVGDAAGVYILVDGEYFGSEQHEPIWPRLELTHASGASIRARLQSLFTTSPVGLA
jgi:hypothetical protein